MKRSRSITWAILQTIAQFDDPRVSLHTGKSFMNYCNATRDEKAAKILANSGTSITTVAFESGFSNLSHFHRQFKAMYGMTPAAL